MARKHTPTQRLEYLKSQHLSYICKHGGYLYMQEADEVNNKLNRLILSAYAAANPLTYIGTVNLYGTQRTDFLNGEISAIKEYHGEKICNFDCDFIIPIKDTELEDLLRQYNEFLCPERVSLGSQIIERVYEIGGIFFLWT